MTNSARGEQVIKIGGVEFTLALEYERIVELEDLTEMGILALAGEFSYLIDVDNYPASLMRSPITIKTVALAVWILSGKSSMYPLPMIGKLILSAGLKEAIDPLSDFFATAIAGAPLGESQAGEQEPLPDDSQ